MTKKRITRKILFIKSVEIIKSWLHLSDWKISVKFVPSMKYTAYCSARPEYKTASICVNLTNLRGLTHNEIVATAAHELLHCIVWPLGSWATMLAKSDQSKIELTRRYEEEVVTNLERILVSLMHTQFNTILLAEGYSPINLTFTDFSITHLT